MSPMDAEHSDGEDTTKSIKRDGTNHHHHKHTHRKGGLPLCPASAPKRRTYGPVPTVAPREPTVAPAPTVADSTGAGPEPAGAEPANMGGVPVDIPPGTQRVLIESRMNYGFFGDVTPAEPTMADIDAMLARTSAWYTEQLQMQFPDLESFQATFVDSMVDLAATDAIKIDFDANAFYTEGKLGKTTPHNKLTSYLVLTPSGIVFGSRWHDSNPC